MFPADNVCLTRIRGYIFHFQTTVSPFPFSQFMSAATFRIYLVCYYPSTTLWFNQVTPNQEKFQLWLQLWTSIWGGHSTFSWQSNMWLWRWRCSEKHSPQFLQIYGFSPVCFLTCTFKWLLCLKAFLQNRQEYGVSPVWIRKWTFKFHLRENDLSQ
jgi:hypothetical protein